MKPFNYSPQTKKWGLFVLMFGALGFTLSMNPDHFNNIARNEGPLEVTELAQTAATADTKARPATNGVKGEKQPRPSELARLKAENAALKAEKEKSAATPQSAAAASTTTSSATTAAAAATTAASATTSTPPGEKPNVPREFKGLKAKVDGQEITFDAVAFSSNNQTKLQVTATEVKSSTSGTAGCLDCFNREFERLIPISASLDNAKEIEEAARKAIETKGKIAAKPGQATEVDLEEWAKPCEKVSESSKLNCHAKRLVLLSKQLKNSSEQADLVKQYFMDHLNSDIKTAFTQPTLREMNVENCDGTIRYSTNMGRVGCYQNENLDKANEMVQEILAGLRTENGKEVSRILFKLEASKFSSQLRNSQQLAIQGKNEGNSYKFAAGLEGMQIFGQQSLVNQTDDDLRMAISRMNGSDSQRASLGNLLTTNFKSPVDDLITRLKNYTLNGNGTAGSHSALDFPIDRLSGDESLFPGQSTIPGAPGNIPGRRGRTARGQGLQWLFPTNGSAGIVSAGIPTTTPSIFTNQQQVQVWNPNVRVSSTQPPLPGTVPSTTGQFFTGNPSFWSSQNNPNQTGLPRAADGSGRTAR